jgi:hypothetical protein
MGTGDDPLDRRRGPSIAGRSARKASVAVRATASEKGGVRGRGGSAIERARPAPLTTRIATIGFTRKSARDFFRLLREGGVRSLIGVRLNNVSQLAGFAEKDDLAYFCEIHGIRYVHRPELAPTRAMLDAYRKNGGDWSAYERRFLTLVREREIEKILRPEDLHEGCLLCSEDRPHRCHRRLVAEHLHERWGSVDIRHLLLPQRRRPG